MTKRDLIMRITEETGMMRNDVKSVIQTALDHIMEAVCRNEKVELRKFGVFEVRVQQSRIGRNPNRPAKTVVIPSRYAVKFKPANDFRQALLKLVPPPKPPPKPAAAAKPEPGPKPVSLPGPKSPAPQK